MKSTLVTVILIALLGGVGGVVQRFGNESHPSKQHKLQSTLEQIPHWVPAGAIPMEDKILKALELDDYLFQRYSNGQQAVTLYIGYYHSAKKVGAAHDPMVCFPGQGWKIHNTSQGVVKIAGERGPEFTYATMTANLGEQSEHILYWFQAYDEPTPTTVMQKIVLLKKTLLRQGQDNAFVRVSIPCSAQDATKCEQTLRDFVQDFYPPFVRHITSP